MSGFGLLFAHELPESLGMSYLIVPVVAGEMTIVTPAGERSKAQLAAESLNFRKAGVQHDVLNETSTEIVFPEIELKR